MRNLKNNKPLLKRVTDKYKRELRPTPVTPARAPLPERLVGLFFVVECAEKTLFTLWCNNDRGERSSYAMGEDELRGVLARFGVGEIPRIVSAAKYNRRVQVIPNVGTGHPQQVISLYPKVPPQDLDWGDGVDHAPVHSLPPPGFRFATVGLD